MNAQAPAWVRLIDQAEKCERMARDFRARAELMRCGDRRSRRARCTGDVDHGGDHTYDAVLHEAYREALP